MVMPHVNPKGIYDGAMSEIRTASTAGGGTALTTGASQIHLRDNIDWISMIGRNYSTAVVIKFALNPYLIILKTSDALATDTNLTDYSSQAQDNDTGTLVTLSSMATFAGNGFLMVGSHLPFRGVGVTIGSTNSTTNVLTVKYWNGTTWADISASDGTTTGGASFGQSGAVTWTVPTAWVKANLNATLLPTPSVAIANPLVRSAGLYWTRWEVSVAMDASTTAQAMISYNRDTVQYAELAPGDRYTTTIKKGLFGIGCIEALTDAGTANIIVNIGDTLGLTGIGL